MDKSINQTGERLAQSKGPSMPAGPRRKQTEAQRMPPGIMTKAALSNLGSELELPAYHSPTPLTLPTAALQCKKTCGC